MLGSVMPTASGPSLVRSEMTTAFSTAVLKLLLMLCSTYRKCLVVWIGSPKDGMMGDVVESE